MWPNSSGTLPFPLYLKARNSLGLGILRFVAYNCLRAVYSSCWHRTRWFSFLLIIQLQRMASTSRGLAGLRLLVSPRTRKDDRRLITTFFRRDQTNQTPHSGPGYPEARGESTSSTLPAIRCVWASLTAIDYAHTEEARVNWLQISGTGPYAYICIRRGTSDSTPFPLAIDVSLGDRRTFVTCSSKL